MKSRSSTYSDWIKRIQVFNNIISPDLPTVPREPHKTTWTDLYKDQRHWHTIQPGWCKQGELQITTICKTTN